MLLSSLVSNWHLYTSLYSLWGFTSHWGFPLVIKVLLETKKESHSIHHLLLHRIISRYLCRSSTYLHYGDFFNFAFSLSLCWGFSCSWFSFYVVEYVRETIEKLGIRWVRIRAMQQERSEYPKGKYNWDHSMNHTYQMCIHIWVW